MLGRGLGNRFFFFFFYSHTTSRGLLRRVFSPSFSGVYYWNRACSFFFFVGFPSRSPFCTIWSRVALCIQQMCVRHLAGLNHDGPIFRGFLGTLFVSFCAFCTLFPGFFLRFAPPALYIQQMCAQHLASPLFLFCYSLHKELSEIFYFSFPLSHPPHVRSSHGW